MTEAKIPAYIPVVASDEGNYPAGINAWNGTPKIAEPSAGQLLAGVVPGTGSWFFAQTFNALARRWGAALSATVDNPSFEVTARAAEGDNGLTYDAGNTAGNTNTSAGGDPPALMVGSDGWTYTQARQTVRKTRLGSGKLYGSASDTVVWDTSGAACGLSTSGETVSSIARPPIMCADRSTGLVCAFGSGGAMKGSTDRGASWSGSHTIDASLSGKAVTAAAPWNGMVVACYTVGAGPNFSGVWVAEQSDLTTWNNPTPGATSNGAGDSSVIGRIITNSDVAILLPRSDNVVHVLAGAFGAQTLTRVDFASHAAVTHWRGAWNEAIGQFMIGNVQGDLWVSQDGLSWAQIYSSGDNLFAVRDIVAHGRGFVVSNSKTEWALDYLSVDDVDLTWKPRRILSAYAGNSGPAAAFHLQAVHGRYMAARIIQGSDTIWRLEWYTSGVQAWDRNNFVGV